MRLAIDRNDASSVAETGTRLVESLEEPLALRHFSAGDWAAVRELEDGVGWGLIPAPPAWPPV